MGGMKYPCCLRKCLIGLCLFLVVLCSCEPSPPSPSKTKDSSAVTAKRNRLWAWRAAQGSVHRKFKDKNLKFPNEYWDAFVDERENNYYVITSYADTQDDRGVPIRIHFECVLRHAGKEWNQVGLSILRQEEI